MAAGMVGDTGAGGAGNGDNAIANSGTVDRDRKKHVMIDSVFDKSFETKARVRQLRHFCVCSTYSYSLVFSHETI